MLQPDRKTFRLTTKRRGSAGSSPWADEKVRENRKVDDKIEREKETGNRESREEFIRIRENEIITRKVNFKSFISTRIPPMQRHYL